MGACSPVFIYCLFIYTNLNFYFRKCKRLGINTRNVLFVFANVFTISSNYNLLNFYARQMCKHKCVCVCVCKLNEFAKFMYTRFVPEQKKKSKNKFL